MGRDWIALHWIGLDWNVPCTDLLGVREHEAGYTPLDGEASRPLAEDDQKGRREGHAGAHHLQTDTQPPGEKKTHTHTKRKNERKQKRKKRSKKKRWMVSVFYLSIDISYRY